VVEKIRWSRFAVAVSAVGALAVLAAAGPAFAMSEGEAEAWAVTYHVRPTPDQVPDALHGLRGGRVFGDPYGSPGMIGFFAGVFAASPDRIDGWLSDLGSYTTNQQMVLIQAVWLSDTPQSKRFLKRVGLPTLRRLHRTDMVEGKPWRISQTPMRDPLMVELVMGHFWATADRADIEGIIGALGREAEGDETSITAATDLTWNAEHDPLVMKICQDASGRPDADPILKDIVRVAQARGDPMTVIRPVMGHSPVQR